MSRKNTIFSKLFISYSLIIVTSLLLFIGVFFYLFHLNLYKKYEDTFQHHYEQSEGLLKNHEKLALDNDQIAESLSYSFNQPDYHIYIVDE
ncbi:hypothetical protein ACWE42_03720 [Sutcliffiella cohnii]